MLVHLAEVMKPLVITVLGCPVPQERARVTKHGTFTPKKSRSYRDLVAWAAQIEVVKTWTLEERKLIKSKDVRWAVDIQFWFPDRKRRDIENCSKAICDALSGIAYYDDAQIDWLNLHRLPSDPKQPRAIIRVNPL